jgi:hypothetical protein
MVTGLQISQVIDVAATGEMHYLKRTPGPTLRHG